MSTEVLPVGRRPRCRACGRELKPNFDTRRGLTGRTKRVYDTPYGGLHRQGRPFTADDRNVEQDAKGRWYREELVTGVVSRTFLGTYGAYKDDMFCGLGCARRWAVGVCKLLESKGEFWITYKEQSR